MAVALSANCRMLRVRVADCLQFLIVLCIVWCAVTATGILRANDSQARG